MARTQQTVLIEFVDELAATGIGVRAACGLVGLPRSTYYRLTRNYRHYRPVTDPIPQKKRRQPAALTADERTAIIAVLESDEYAELSVVQTYWRAFDAGRVGCSERTFYRVATEQNMVGDRRRRKYGGGSTPRHKPIVHCGRVGDLWSWDVTELRGPRTQDRYKLYLVIDVFSRYPVAWRIEYTENTDLAVQMFATAIAEHGAPGVVHADNGSIMRAHTLVDALAGNGVLASYARPRVSDDNPFSESLFKTIKYDLSCPLVFDSIDHARHWTAEFLHRYATEHRHSGLGRHTPAAIHAGTAALDRQRRQQALDRYWSQHPERFRARPVAPALPGPTGINTNVSQTG
ncbi:IS3 family transposase [Rhodococcus sp. NCIMB 12038]|uniref:IS3 family transposase n=1 Tax=Rhodococcus sp. NCIMB 12038 TaxID=933800 RepID=UPI000B54EDE1|nr:IS3 family transposase [Rhodococcus sp. NCIMB 12038]OUS95466.1 IS3 family transposase [Rhodococcus sp. NCIMB 12038]